MLSIAVHLLSVEEVAAETRSPGSQRSVEIHSAPTGPQLPGATRRRADVPQCHASPAAFHVSPCLWIDGLESAGGDAGSIDWHGQPTPARPAPTAVNHLISPDNALVSPAVSTSDCYAPLEKMLPTPTPSMFDIELPIWGGGSSSPLPGPRARTPFTSSIPPAQSD